MSALDLKPCPFCGKPAKLTENEYSAPMVACEWCLARTCSHSDSLAIDKWNRRPGEDALRARAEAAEAERDALRARALIADQWRAFALEVALQVAPLGEEQRAAQTTVRDLPAVTEALREVVAERDRADQRADRAYAYKVVAENEAAALRARAEAAEAALVLACPHCGPEHFAGPDADGACVMCMGTLIRTDAAGAVLAHELYNGAHVVEAALATARAEGAAAERAAVVAWLRRTAVDISPIGLPDGELTCITDDIEEGRHVRPVEGA
jgi:rubrerythrin